MRFKDDVVESICNYMNNDPMESNLTIVQGITGDRTIESASLADFDGEGATFHAQLPGEVKEIRIAWEHPISERPQVREQLFALLNKAMDSFGTQ